MPIQCCNCGKCRKESEHNLGFVWERKGERWFKSYSIKPRARLISSFTRLNSIEFRNSNGNSNYTY